MFITVLFGDSREKILNLNCRLINFIHDLKEMCSLDLKECVDLLDSRGRVMNLESHLHSYAPASSVLEERQSYVVLKVCRYPDTGGLKYVSLLNNFSQSHPELAEILRKLSNPNKDKDRRITGGRTRTKNKSSIPRNHI